MKHHLADFLDRAGDYWTMVPNRERFAYAADKEITDKEAVKILTINKHHERWEQLFDCVNIEELTLHDPSRDQVERIRTLTGLERLRISFFRTDNIDFITSFYNLEELIFEYVSGFSDLSPLRELKKLKSVHFENLCRVKSFDGLKDSQSLKYLHITGTLDWNQPIEDFKFLEHLTSLEVFSLGFIINKSEYPAFLPILKLKNLKKINIGRSTFHTKEYAFLETALPETEGAKWDLYWQYNKTLEFLGKKAGRASIDNPLAKEKCDEFAKEYNRMKSEAEAMIKSLML